MSLRFPRSRASEHWGSGEAGLSGAGREPLSPEKEARGPSCPTVLMPGPRGSVSIHLLAFLLPRGGRKSISLLKLCGYFLQGLHGDKGSLESYGEVVPQDLEIRHQASASVRL